MIWSGDRPSAAASGFAPPAPLCPPPPSTDDEIVTLAHDDATQATINTNQPGTVRASMRPPWSGTRYHGRLTEPAADTPTPSYRSRASPEDDAAHDPRVH